MAPADQAEPSLLFRSEEMQYVRMTMAHDAAHDTMAEIARLGAVHLVDLQGEDAALSEGFMYYKKRVVACDQWERKLQWFRGEMESNGVEAPGLETDAEELKTSGDVLAELQDYIVPLEEELNRNVEFRNSQRRDLHALLEQQLVLQTLKGQLNQPLDFNRDIFGNEQAVRADAVDGVELSERQPQELKESLLSNSSRRASDDLSADLEAASERRAVGRAPGDSFHNYVCGIIPVAQQPLFERMLFRASRGNAYGRFTLLPGETPDPATGQLQQKAVFYVVYIGSALQRRIEKMCEFFHATTFDVPRDPAEAERRALSLESSRVEKEHVLAQTDKQVEELLRSVAWWGGTSPLRNWEEAVRREKVVCDGLKRSHMPDGSSIVTAEGWVPLVNLDALRLAVRTATRASGAQPAVLQELDLGADVAPPTHFRTNKVTGTFQGIVNTYGVPRYREVNPGLFTIATFPFLFGVMYADMFHGTMLSLFGLFLVVREKAFGKMKREGRLGELPGMAYNGRYLLMLMGIAAVYCGTIYNDCASVPVSAFGRTWTYETECLHEGCADANNTATWSGDVYPYGVDPTWYHTKNELTFFNSLKMKVSVTLGVIHMTFGIILGLFNHLHFNDTTSIVYEFIPQLLFMLSTFGYMVFMIVRKMTIDYAANPHRVPPNLINTLISMFLSPGSVPKEEELYPGQATVQLGLVLTAVVCIPWMLFLKPFALRRKHRAEQKKAAAGAAGGGLLADHGASAGVVVPVGASLNSPHGEHRPLAPAAFDSADDSGLYEDPHADDHGAGHSHAHGSLAFSRSRAKAGAGAGDDGHGEGFNFGEVFIHQAIHTIEFVLGAVSNTASYLRLWALSLAHSELSSVFWEKLIMEYGVKTGKGYMVFVGWGAWAAATFAVLLCMDTLEAFLHALRLHWVEFQNKFYNADGYAFNAFSFERKEEE